IRTTHRAQHHANLSERLVMAVPGSALRGIFVFAYICDRKLKWLNDVRDFSPERRQNAKRFLVDQEFNWTLAGQFAIELKGNILLARYAQAASLKIFNLGSANLRAEYDVLKILDDLEVTQPFENDDVKQTIIDNGVLKEWERAAVKAPVS